MAGLVDRSNTQKYKYELAESSESSIFAMDFKKNNMKKLLFIFIALVFAGIANAQSNKEEVDFMQSIFGMEKKALVADFMNVDQSKADAFWKLYDEYEVQRKEYGKKRLVLLDDYAKNYNSMSAEAADKWMGEVIKGTAANEKLIVTYYKKIKKVTDPVTALKFYHVETYIASSIRSAIASELPFVKAK